MPVNPIMATYFIADGGPGFAVRHFLKASIIDFVSAIPICNELARRRRACLAAGATVVWARVARTDSLHRSKAAITSPLTAYDDPAPPAASLGRGPANKIGDGLLIRYETSDGMFGTPIIRCVPDVKIFDELFTEAPVDFTGGAGANPLDGTSTWVNAFIDYVRYVRDNTTCAQLKTPPANNYLITDWDTALYRRTAFHKTGRSFGEPRGRA